MFTDSPFVQFFGADKYAQGSNKTQVAEKGSFLEVSEGVPSQLSKDINLLVINNIALSLSISLMKEEGIQKPLAIYCNFS